MRMRGKKTGFSMIEIALVMGLAGVIFLMAFTLVPQLQRNQRDEARKDDVMAIVQNLKKFQTNNKGVLPKGTNIVSNCPSNPVDNGWDGFYCDYMSSEDVHDPNGDNYTIMPVECVNSAKKRGEQCNYSDSVNNALSKLSTLVIFTQASCKEDYAAYADNPRNFAIVARLEGSGTFCFGS